MLKTMNEFILKYDINFIKLCTPAHFKIMLEYCKKILNLLLQSITFSEYEYESASRAMYR